MVPIPVRLLKQLALADGCDQGHVGQTSAHLHTSFVTDTPRLAKNQTASVTTYNAFIGYGC